MISSASFFACVSERPAAVITLSILALSKSSEDPSFLITSIFIEFTFYYFLLNLSICQIYQGGIKTRRVLVKQKSKGERISPTLGPLTITLSHSGLTCTFFWFIIFHLHGRNY